MGKTPEEIAGPYATQIALLIMEVLENGSGKLSEPLTPIIAAAIRKDRAEPVSEEEVERFGQEMASIVDEEWPPKREPEEARKYARIICEAARKARTE